MTTSPLRTVTAVASAAVLAFSLAGCGSDDKKDSSSKSSTLSSADFKTKANALCKTANTEIATLEEGLGAATTEEEATAAVDKLVTRVDGLVSSIKALKEPADLSSGVDAMLGAVTAVTDKIKSEGLAYFTNQTADPFAEADAKAEALGLDECAGNS